MEKRNYEQLAKKAVKTYGVETVVVFTGERNKDGLPIFHEAILGDAVKVQRNGRWLWGFSVYDPDQDEQMWVDYNHCVSLEGFEVLERLLDAQFPWIRMVSGLRESVIMGARMMLSAAEETPLYVQHFCND
ncbi:MAG: hypothetical protein ACI3ZW_07450 [Parabacteroides sp.]